MKIKFCAQLLFILLHCITKSRAEYYVKLQNLQHTNTEKGAKAVETAVMWMQMPQMNKI